MKSASCLPVVTFWALALSHSSAFSQQSDGYGQMAYRYMATAKMLETLTGGECKSFAVAPHSAEPDIKLVLTSLPPSIADEMRSELGFFLKAIEGNNEKEFAGIKDKLGGASQELKCGFLLGIASVTYYQSRKDWAERHRLSAPRWERP